MSVVEGQARLVEVPRSVELAAGAGAGWCGEEAFRAYEPEQVLLMAPVLSEWVPEGVLAHFVSDLVETGAVEDVGDLLLVRGGGLGLSAV